MVWVVILGLLLVGTPIPWNFFLCGIGRWGRPVSTMSTQRIRMQDDLQRRLGRLVRNRYTKCTMEKQTEQLHSIPSFAHGAPSRRQHGHRGLAHHQVDGHPSMEITRAPTRRLLTFRSTMK